jgi:long-chain fatty acid transport protein
LDWNDVWTVKVGLEYRITDAVALRTGYTYAETPVPEETLSPAHPDADQHMLNVGFGYRMNKWVADFFYTASFFEERKVNNNVLSGKYESIMHLIGFSFGYRF